MKRYAVHVLLLTLVAVVAIRAQTKIQAPAPAESLLKAAIEKARSQDKNIMLHFEASWCSWCRRLDDAMVSDELRHLFEDNFVFLALTVLESDEKKSTENPGAETLMKKMGGENAGLPFYVFLKSDGTPIANSVALSKDVNIGYPATAEEINAFAGLLDRTAPRMTTEQRAGLIEYLQKHAPSRN